MGEITSVGIIGLDLVVGKEQFFKQLEDIQKSTSAMLTKPMEKVGVDMARAVSEPMQKALSSTRKTVDDVMKDIGDAEKKQIDAAVARAVQQAKAATNQIGGQEEPRSATVTGYAKTAGAVLDGKESAAAAEIAPLMEQARAKADAYVQELQSTATPIDLLRDKMAGVNADVEAQLASVRELATQAQMVSLGKTGDTSELDAKLTEATDKLRKLQADAAATNAKMVKLLNPQAPKLPKQINEVTVAAEKAKNAGNSAFVSMGGSAKKLGRSIANAAKSALLISLVYQAFRGLQQYMAGALSTNKEFVSSMNTIKSSLAVAFQSVFSAILPALTALMQGVAKVATFIAAVISSLLGTTFSKSAAGAKKMQAQTQKAAGGAKKAGTEAKKSMAAFDDLNVLSDDKEDSSGGGGGGTAPAMDFSSITPPDVTWVDTLKTKLADIIGAVKAEFAPTVKAAIAKITPELSKLKTTFAGVFADTQKLGEPLQKWFTTDLVAFVHQGIATAGTVIAGLLGSFNLVFGDIWNVVIYPSFAKFATVILPMLTQFGTNMLSVFGVLFGEVKRIFDTLWSDAVAPALGMITKIWSDCWDSISAAWAKWGQPIFGAVEKAITVTGDVLLSVWNSFLKPIWDKFMELVDTVWTEHLKPLLDNFLDFVGEFAKGALDIYNNFIAPIVKWLVEIFGPIFATVFNTIQTVIATVISHVIDIINGIITTLKGIIQFISGVFSGDMSKAWNGIKNIIGGVWDAIVGVVKAPINLIIDLVNGMVRGICAGINAAIRVINKLSFTVPDWVPGLGGETLGFNLPEVSAPQIPKLARGAVVSQPTLSLIGERGREAVMPLEHNTGWIAQLAGQIASMSPAFGSASQPIELVINFNGNMAQLARIMQPELDRNSKRKGVSLVVGGA